MRLVSQPINSHLPSEFKMFTELYKAVIQAYMKTGQQSALLEMSYNYLIEIKIFRQNI